MLVQFWNLDNYIKVGLHAWSHFSCSFFSLEPNVPILLQVYDMETSYLQDPSQCGNVLKGYEGFLSSSKSTTLYVHWLSLFLLTYGLLRFLNSYTGTPDFMTLIITTNYENSMFQMNSESFLSSRVLFWMNFICIDYEWWKLLENSGCSLKRSRKFQPEDRLFSLSSVTSPAVCSLPIWYCIWHLQHFSLLTCFS